MLLQRKTVIDSKLGTVEAVVLRVCGNDGRPKDVTLTGAAARRFNQLDRAMRSMGGLFEDAISNAFDSTDPLAWNISQLAYTEAEMLKKDRPKTFYKELVPLSFEAPAWATSIEQQVYDDVGVADLEASDSTEMPMADARFDRAVIEVRGGKMGYHYDVQELIESAQLKRPLSDMRMVAAQNAYDRHMNVIATRGSVKNSIKGLWNQSGVTPVAATTGAWDNPSTSALAIAADLQKPITAVHENTGGQAFVTDIAMPLKALSALSSTLLTASSSGIVVPTPITLLEWIKQNNISKSVGGIDIKFHGIPVDKTAAGADNTTAGTSLDVAGTLAHDGTTPKTTSRVVYYVKTKDRLVMHLPLPLTFLAPQPRNTDIVVPGRYRYTGPKLLYVKSMYYQDCVLAADVV